MNIGADGLATGYTEGLGYSITFSAARNGRRLFATLAGLASEEERAEEARKMLDWGMNAFAMRQIFAAGETIGEASVYGGEKDRVKLRAAEPVSILVPVAETDQISAAVVYEGPIPAPIEEG